MVEIFAFLKGVTPATFGAYAILMALVVAYTMNWIVSGKTHDRVVAERDRYLEMATRGMELAKRVADVAGAPPAPPSSRTQP